MRSHLEPKRGRPKVRIDQRGSDLWLQPIIIKKEANPDARVRYPSLIGGCLKPHLASLLEIEDTDAGWSSIDNEGFPYLCLVTWL